jgi:WD40 repeat protein
MSALLTNQFADPTRQGTTFFSHRPTSIEFCKDLWSSVDNEPPTSLLLVGGSSHGDAGGKGCLYLNRVLPVDNDLELRKEHWRPTPGGVTCMSSETTIGQINQIDNVVVGTDAGNVCIVQVDKKQALFLPSSSFSIALNPDAKEPCSITAISAAKQRQQAVAVTDSGGVYLLEALYQNAHSTSIVPFNVRENSAINDVTHLQESPCFATVGASPVAQLKLWDPRVATKDGNAVVAAFKDEDASVSYTSVAAHPPDKHLVMAGTSDGHVCIWDTRQGQVKNRSQKHREAVTSLCFGSTTSSVYTISSDGSALHWDFKAHAMKNDNIVSYYDHEAFVTKCKVAPLWETPPGVAVQANDIAVPSDGRADLVAVAYEDGAVVVRDM